MGIEVLDGGEAFPMGDGVFIIIQPDEYGVYQNVVITEDDMRRMLAAD